LALIFASKFFLDFSFFSFFLKNFAPDFPIFYVKLLDFCLHFEKFIFQIFYLDFFVSDFYSFLKEICLFLCLDFEKN